MLLLVAPAGRTSYSIYITYTMIYAFVYMYIVYTTGVFRIVRSVVM